MCGSPLTPDERRLQEEVRTFLDEHRPGPAEVPADFDERIDFLRGWQRRLHEAG